MPYNLKQCRYKNGRVFLEIVDSIYSRKKGYSIPKVIKKIGYLDELEKIYVDPISYFKEEIKKMELERKKENNFIPRQSDEINLGSFLPIHLLNKLRLKDLSNAIDQSSKRTYSHYDVLEFLTLSRIIYPSSKIDTYMNMFPHFYKKYSFSKDQMYDALGLIGEYDEAYLNILNDKINKIYGRNLSHVYFDCTNYYFEIDANNYDGYRLPGVSKENHQGAIISLGLLLDSDAIPLYYSLFPGNQSEKPELNKTIKKMKDSLDIKGRTIRVADKGLNSVDNIIDAYKNGDGYVYSKAIRSNDDKKMILEGETFEEIKDENGEVIFKVKVWIDNYDYVQDNRTYKLREKRIVIWSRKYALKSAYERNRAIDKVNKQSSISNLKSKDSPKFIHTLYDVISEESGKIISNDDISLILNESKVDKASELDGYYMIVTSETNLSWKEILDIYRKLWEIEASFRITKTQLETRPIYVSSLNSIKGHFFSCYLALTLIRLIQKKELDDKYNAEKVIDFVKTLKAFPISNEQYLLSGSYQDIIKEIETRYKVSFNLKTLSLSKIEKLFSI